MLRDGERSASSPPPSSDPRAGRQAEQYTSGCLPRLFFCRGSRSRSRPQVRGDAQSFSTAAFLTDAPGGVPHSASSLGSIVPNERPLGLSPFVHVPIYVQSRDPAVDNDEKLNWVDAAPPAATFPPAALSAKDKSLHARLRRGTPDDLKGLVWFKALGADVFFASRPHFYENKLQETFGTRRPREFSTRVPTFSGGFLGVEEELTGSLLDVSKLEPHADLPAVIHHSEISWTDLGALAPNLSSGASRRRRGRGNTTSSASSAWAGQQTPFGRGGVYGKGGLEELAAASTAATRAGAAGGGGSRRGRGFGRGKGAAAGAGAGAGGAAPAAPPPLGSLSAAGNFAEAASFGGPASVSGSVSAATTGFGGRRRRSSELKQFVESQLFQYQHYRLAPFPIFSRGNAPAHPALLAPGGAGPGPDTGPGPGAQGRGRRRRLRSEGAGLPADPQAPQAKPAKPAAQAALLLQSPASPASPPSPASSPPLTPRKSSAAAGAARTPSTAPHPPPLSIDEYSQSPPGSAVGADEIAQFLARPRGTRGKRGGAGKQLARLRSRSYDEVPSAGASSDDEDGSELDTVSTTTFDTNCDATEGSPGITLDDSPAAAVPPPPSAAAPPPDATNGLLPSEEGVEGMAAPAASPAFPASVAPPAAPPPAAPPAAAPPAAASASAMLLAPRRTHFSRSMDEIHRPLPSADSASGSALGEAAAAAAAAVRFGELTYNESPGAGTPGAATPPTPPRSLNELESATHLHHLLLPAGVQAVRRLLWVLSAIFPDLEFCPVLPNLCCVLLLYLAEERAFILLYRIFSVARERMRESHSSRPFLVYRRTDFVRFVKLVDATARKHLGKLVDRLELFGVDVSAWIARTLSDGLARAVPFNLLLRIYCAFIYEGYKVFQRYTLALLKLRENRFARCTSFDEILAVLEDRMADMQTVEEVNHATKVAFRFAFSASHRSIAKYTSFQLPTPYLASVKLQRLYRPRLREESSFLVDADWERIWSWLPQRLLVLDPMLRWRSDRDGTHLLAMQNKLAPFAADPMVFALLTRTGEVVGGFAMVPFTIAPRDAARAPAKDAFLFRLRAGEPQVFFWSGEADTFMSASQEHIALGTEEVALFVDQAVYRGHCAPSKAFRCPRLAGDEHGDFVVACMEIWTLE